MTFDKSSSYGNTLKNLQKVAILECKAFSKVKKLEEYYLRIIHGPPNYLKVQTKIKCNIHNVSDVKQTNAALVNYLVFYLEV